MQTHYGQALRFREKALALAERAFKTLSDILDDPEASPSVRLRAATFLIQTAIAPPPYKPEKPLGVLDLPMDQVFGKNEIAAQMKREREELKKEEEEEEEEENSQSAAQKDENLHKNAQKQGPYRRPGPKIGRNHPRPCGSGKKHKFCCLNKPAGAAA